MVGLLETKIVVVLGYSAQFDFPLTADEVWLRLPFVAQSSVTKKAVVVALTSLVERSLIYAVGGFFSTKAPRYWVNREQRAITSTSKLAEATKVCEKLAQVPLVLAVGVTGSVAAKNAKENDDIDFIIITKKNSLWIVRLLIILFSVGRGKRRSWNHEEENSWCFNLWLEETRLAFPATTPLYTSYELCQVCWLYSREGVVSRIFDQNQWVRAVVPFFYERQKRVGHTATYYRNQVGLVGSWLLSLATGSVNMVLFFFQRVYMQRHITSEKIGYSYAFFHPRNTPKAIVGGWKRELINWHRGLGEGSRQDRVLPKRIEKIVQKARDTGKTIVLATGVFDVFHSEHRIFLEKARKAGDILLVGIESDFRVRQIKGPGRPINSQRQRQQRLERERLADGVFVLPEQFTHHDDFLKFVRAVTPQILAVSSHTAHLDHKKRIMDEVGGVVLVVHQHNPQVSTTRSIELGKKL